MLSNNKNEVYKNKPRILWSKVIENKSTIRKQKKTYTKTKNCIGIHIKSTNHLKKSIGRNNCNNVCNM